MEKYAIEKTKKATRTEIAKMAGNPIEY